MNPFPNTRCPFTWFHKIQKHDSFFGLCATDQTKIVGTCKSVVHSYIWCHMRRRNDHFVITRNHTALVPRSLSPYPRWLLFLILWQSCKNPLRGYTLKFIPIPSDGRFRNFCTQFDAIRFFEKISISNYERFLPFISRLVHLAQSVAATTINVANLV